MCVFLIYICIYIYLYVYNVTYVDKCVYPYVYYMSITFLHILHVHKCIDIMHDVFYMYVYMHIWICIYIYIYLYVWEYPPQLFQQWGLSIPFHTPVVLGSGVLHMGSWGLGSLGPAVGRPLFWAWVLEIVVLGSASPITQVTHAYPWLPAYTQNCRETRPPKGYPKALHNEST